MEKQPFFTIGIPVYNTEKWIGECLDSILSQDFTDFEIICVNDGSTDNSLQILNAYAEKDSRIRVITRPNGGPATARNAALLSAKGQYIFFIDSDDTMNKNVLQQGFDVITANSYPDLLETGLTVKRNGKITEYHPVIADKTLFDGSLSKDERTVLLWLNGQFLPSVCRKFIKCSLISKNGLSFDTRYIISEDFDFSMSCYRKLDTVAYGDFQAITYFNPREGSITSNISHKSYYTALCHESELFRDLKYWNLSDSTRILVKERHTQFIKDKLEYCFNQLHNNISREFALERCDVIEPFIAPHIKELPLPKDRNAILYIMCRIFGIRKTVSMLYDYLKAKGVITNG